MEKIDFGKMAEDYFSNNGLERVATTEIKPIWQTTLWKRKFIVIPDVFNQSSNRYFLGTYVALQSLCPDDGYLITSIKQIINRFGETPKTGSDKARLYNVNFVRDALNGLGYLGVIDEQDYRGFSPEQEFGIRLLSNDGIIERFRLKIRRSGEEEIPKYRVKRCNPILSADILGYRLFEQTQETVAQGHRIKFPRYITCISMIRRCMRVLDRRKFGLESALCGTRVRASTLSDLLGMGVKEVGKLLQNLEISEVFRFKQLSEKQEEKDNPLYSILDWVEKSDYDLLDYPPEVTEEVPIQAELGEEAYAAWDAVMGLSECSPIDATRAVNFKRGGRYVC